MKIWKLALDLDHIKHRIAFYFIIWLLVNTVDIILGTLLLWVVQFGGGLIGSAIWDAVFGGRFAGPAIYYASVRIFIMIVIIGELIYRLRKREYPYFQD
jgi:hypothetical protein